MAFPNHSLKHVLFHNVKVYETVLIGHSIYLWEEYNDIKTVTDLPKYHKHPWTIYIDIQMVNFLLVQQRGFTKVPCYFYMWTAKLIETIEPGVANTWDSGSRSVEYCKWSGCQLRLFFPTLHAKLGLMKQFVKASNIESECFWNIISDLPALSFEEK